MLDFFILCICLFVICGLFLKITDWSENIIERKATAISQMIIQLDWSYSVLACEILRFIMFTIMIIILGLYWINEDISNIFISLSNIFL